MVMMKDGYSQPIPTVKSVRPDEWRGLTSVKAGVMTPVCFIPLLREDRLRASGTVQVRSEETLHTIVNPVRVRVESYLIPKTVLERFQGSLEMLNRSYEGEAAPAGMGTTPKWFVKHPALPGFDKGHELFDKLGVHWSPADEFNTDLVESYNQLVNWMRSNVSPGLPHRDLLNTTCAPAFWQSWRFADIKPSFDAGLMEGAVPVGLDGRLTTGIHRSNTGNLVQGPANLGGDSDFIAIGSTAGEITFNAKKGESLSIDLSNQAATISLANIELANQTQQFAAMRDRYKSVPDEYLIDLLMAGINVPDADLRQPVRLSYAEAILGQTERYATDGASLDTSVSNGMAVVNFTINTPAINTGGMVIVLLSIVPEQLYERIEDVSLRYEDGDIGDVKTPKYVEDYLDPQKVEVVPNSFADVMHANFDSVFGYAPLNYQWRRSFSRVGGKFKRPSADAFVEDRQRIWAVEKKDPTLSADFYLCPSPFPHDVFANKNADPYEVITVVQSQITGNTVFGPGFEEDLNSYDSIMATVDKARIAGTPVSQLPQAATGMANDPLTMAADAPDAKDLNNA